MVIRSDTVTDVLARLEVGDLVRVAQTRQGVVTEVDAAAGTFTMDLEDDFLGGDAEPSWRFLAEDSGTARLAILAKAQSWQLGDVVLHRDRIYQLVEEPTVTGATELMWARTGRAAKYPADHVPPTAELLVREGVAQAPQREAATRRDRTGIAAEGLRAARTSTAAEAEAVSADTAPEVVPLAPVDAPIENNTVVAVHQGTRNVDLAESIEDGARGE